MSGELVPLEIPSTRYEIDGKIILVSNYRMVYTDGPEGMMVRFECDCQVFPPSPQAFSGEPSGDPSQEIHPQGNP